jgi:hypothetical protein
MTFQSSYSPLVGSIIVLGWIATAVVGAATVPMFAPE